MRALLRTDSGESLLLSLRALQAELFLAALEDFERTGKESSELLELGGPFLQAVGATWIDEDGRLLPPDDALRLAHRMYWTGLVGLLDVRPFSPSLEEQRRYYRTNLLFPPARSRDRIALLTSRLGTVRALSRSDPAYPSGVAAGILHLELGQFSKAESALFTHLREHPDGPWTQVAKNHLLLAAKHAGLGYESAPPPSR